MSSEPESNTADEVFEADLALASAEPPPIPEVTTDAKGPKPPVSKETYRARRGWLAGVIVLGAVAGVIGLTFLPGRKEEQPEAKRPLVNVKVMTVVARDFRDTFHLPGVVEPNKTVTISARVGGQVTAVSKVDGRTEGRVCKAGETIVTLDTELLAAREAQVDAQVRQYAAQVAQGQAQRDLAKFEMDAIAELRGQGASTAFAYNQAKASLAAALAGIDRARASQVGAEAARKAARIDLGYATITAPCAGVLDEVMVEVGENVEVGLPVARIVDTATVRVVVDVPQTDVGYLELGGPATVLAERDVHGRRAEVAGTIDYISESADAGAKTTRAEVLVTNDSRAFRSGQIVHVELTRRTVGRAVMVPLEAVIPMGNNDRAVYVVRDGKASRRLVTLGLWRGRQVRIMPDHRDGWGLRDGDVLIVEGHRYVAEGQSVRVSPSVPRSQPASATAQQPVRSVVSSGRSQAGQS